MKRVFILSCFLIGNFLLQGCAQHRVIIRASDPPRRSENVLKVDTYELPTSTPEQCYLSVDELLYDGIRWFPRQPDPLHINNQALTDITAHANFMVRMIDNQDYIWTNHLYAPLVMHKAAWVELFGLLSMKAVPDDIISWDLQLRQLLRAKQYALSGLKYSREPEWVRLNERVRFIIDQSYEDLDWMRQYLRHWICSNVLAPANHDSTYFCESMRILLNLRDRATDKFDVILLSDLEEIEDRIKYFEINCGNIDSIISPEVILEDGIIVPNTGMNNPDAVGVVVGITDYDSPEVSKVKYAAHGANRIREVLVKTLGYRKENILPQDPSQKMTYGRMKELIRTILPAYVQPGESDVFIYFSCHGVPLVDNNDVGLVPVDCNPNFATRDNAYALNDLYKDLSNLDVKSLTLVLDCCFSGRDGSGAPLIRDASPPWILVGDNAGHFTKPNYTEFLACQRNQLSNWYTERSHSFFTYFFLKGIAGEADGVGGEADGLLTYEEMKTYIEDPKHGIPWHSLRYGGRPQNPATYGLKLNRIFVDYR